LLLGDAAHAVVPFFGQGMNAGFEDVDIFMDMLQSATNWEDLLNDFSIARKPDADAIADLALANFIEMRDTVSDPSFQLEKKITNRLSVLMPEQWVPMYTLVSFTSTPYSVAAAQGKIQKRVARQIMAMPDAEQNYMDDAWLLDAFQQVTAGVAV
jgi:kynurenine 3-monooxygenase